MPFRFVGYNKQIDTASPEGTRQSMLDLVQWASYEFQGVASAMLSTEADKIWHAAPPKPRAGTQAYADGTNWNPGAGEGFYEYTSAGWVPMFVSGGWYSAWTPYTPTFSVYSAGPFGGTVSGRYKLIGKTCFVQIQFTTTSFTAAGYPAFGLPFAASSSALNVIIPGREVAVVGYMQQGIVGPGNNFMPVFRYDNGVSIGANGYVLSMNGVYETA